MQYICNMNQCSCPENDFEMGTVLQNCQMTSTSEISTNSYEPNSVANISHVQILHVCKVCIQAHMNF